MRYYHLFKQSRQYTGHPYCGPTSIYMEAEFSSLEDAKKAQQEFTERNPVGWDIYDSETMSIYNHKTQQFDKFCDRCGKNPATEPHTCPFAEEINGDSETLCTCCDECQDQCAGDI